MHKGFWDIFLATGSISAYLAYKRIEDSLNGDN